MPKLISDSERDDINFCYDRGLTPYHASHFSGANEDTIRRHYRYRHMGYTSFDDYDQSRREELSALLRDRLTRLGRSQSWLASEVGIHRASITRYIQKKEYPQKCILDKLYDVLFPVSLTKESFREPYVQATRILLQRSPSLYDYFFSFCDGFGFEVFQLIEPFYTENPILTESLARRLVDESRSITHRRGLDLIDSCSCLDFNNFSDSSFLSIGRFSFENLEKDLVKSIDAYTELERIIGFI